MRSAIACVSVAVLLSACSGGHLATSPLPAENAPIAGSIAGGSAANSPAQGDDWPTFARNEMRQSYETLQTAINQKTVSQLQLRWVYPAKPKASFNASPIVVNGVVYVVDVNGVVTALDALTGAPKWASSYQIPNATDVKMTPALYDGKLFVGSWQQPWTASSTFSMTALDPATGHLLWTHSLPGGVHGSPVAANGVLYVPVAIGDAPACLPGGVYALDENTGAPIGSPWLTDPNGGTGGDGGGVWSSLTYDGKQMYYGTGNTCHHSPDTANSIVALSPGSTIANWNINTASPLTDDDIGGTIMRAGDSAFAMGKNGIFYDINVVNGGVTWRKNLGAPDGSGGFATPSVTDGTIIVSGGYIHNPDTYNGEPGGRLYGLTGQGAIRWDRQDFVTPVLGYVAVTPDLAFTPINTTLAALDPLTGKTLWSYPTVGYHYASPVIVPSGLFAADESGRLYAFGLPTNGAKSSSVLTPAAIRRLQLQQPPQIHRKPKFCMTRT
jgi:outer membrane protein assembly factor BamB